MSMKAWAFGLAALIAASSAASACDWHKSMTSASVPVTRHYVIAADVPVDLWLVPYLA